MKKLYALENEILVGSTAEPLYIYTNAKGLEVNSLHGVFSVDTIGNELSIDTFSFVVRYGSTKILYKTSDDKLYKLSNNALYVLRQVKPKDYLKELPFGTPIWWYIEDEFFVKGYLKSVERIGKYEFRLNCVSGVGLLDTTMHVGGLYQAASISDVLASIIGSKFTYTVSEAVEISRIYGRLPYDTCRNNLHKLLFATGAVLMKSDDETDYVIDYLPETPIEVPGSRVAVQGDVDYQLPSNKVEITEHAFFYNASMPTETLFDNTSEVPAENLAIVFDSPVYVDSLATTGTLTISESGVNYAIVNGLGTLTGKYYVHTKQITSLKNNPNNDPERIRRVTSNELVTALNSRNVARRVLSYYQSAKTVTGKIILDGEKCGNLIRLTDTFGDITQGFLAQIEPLVTAAIGAKCKLIGGYQPGNNGNNFLHREAITEDGTWTVPEGVTFIRIALIGGGNGGSGGYDGAEGAYKYKGSSIFDPGEPGGEVTYQYDSWGEYYGGMLYYGYANQEQRIPAGGAAGNVGTQGKVYVIERTVTPGEVITFAIGAGGAGGARNGGVGAAGTPTSVSSTSIGSASSADGLVTQGYFDPFNGDVFATVGVVGVRGGNGGRTDTISFHGNQGGNGLAGESVAGYQGGAGGVGRTYDYDTGIYGVGSVTCRASAGGGGGAAFGANGSAGGSTTENSSWPKQLTSGAGGNGANAIPHPKPTYGCGGAGGNGGGAGGNCGGVAGYVTSSDVSTVIYKHVGGVGGRGSVGGAGGDGIAIIYW